MPRFHGHDTVLPRGRRRKIRKITQTIISPESTNYIQTTTSSACYHDDDNDNDDNEDDTAQSDSTQSLSKNTGVALYSRSDQAGIVTATTEGLSLSSCGVSSVTPISGNIARHDKGVAFIAADASATSVVEEMENNMTENNMQTDKDDNDDDDHHQDSEHSKTSSQHENHGIIQNSHKTNGVMKQSIVQLSKDLNIQQQQPESIYVDDTNQSETNVKQLLDDCILHNKGRIPEPVVAFLVCQLLQLAINKHPGWVLEEIHHGNLEVLRLVRHCDCGEMATTKVGSTTTTSSWRLMYSSEAILEYVAKDHDCNHRLYTMFVNLVALMLLGIDVTGDDYHVDKLNKMICNNLYIGQKNMWSTSFQAIMSGDFHQAISILSSNNHNNTIMAHSYLDALFKNDAWREASVMPMASSSASPSASSSPTFGSSSLPEPRILLFESLTSSEEEEKGDGKMSSDDDDDDDEILETKLQQAKLLVKRYEEMLLRQGQQKQQQQDQSKEQDQEVQSMEEERESRILTSFINNKSLKPSLIMQSSPNKGNFVITINDSEEVSDSDNEWGYV